MELLDLDDIREIISEVGVTKYNKQVLEGVAQDIWNYCFTQVDISFEKGAKYARTDDVQYQIEDAEQAAFADGYSIGYDDALQDNGTKNG